jgi:hypothetical protein
LGNDLAIQAERKIPFGRNDLHRVDDSFAEGFPTADREGRREI